MNLGYSWSVEGEAYRYLVSFPRRRRAVLERLIDHIAAHPMNSPLFILKDDDGNPLHVIEREGYLITYHPDHAIRRIRVTEIQPL